MLTHQRNEINMLKRLVESLTAKISSQQPKLTETSTTTINPQPPPNQLLQVTQSLSTLNLIQSFDSTSQHKVATTSKKPATQDDKTQDDHKFNIVIHGIDERSKGTPKKE